MLADDAALAAPIEETVDSSLSAPVRPPRIWTVFATWLAAAFVGQTSVFAAMIGFGVVAGVALGVQGVDPDTIPMRVTETVQNPFAALLLTLVPFQLGLLAVVWWAARCSAVPTYERLGLVPASGRELSRGRLALMAAFTVATALGAVVGASLLLGSEPPPTPVGSLVSNGSWWTLMLVSVVVSVLPALVEEIVFRGYIQRRLLQRWSPAAAIGVSTLLFAVLHADSLQHIIAVVPLGIVTGLVAHRTQSVKPGMLLHGVHNVAAVGFGAFGAALTPAFGEEVVGMILLGAIAVLGLVGLPAVIRLARSDKPRTEVAPVLDGDAGLATFLTESGFASPAA